MLRVKDYEIRWSHKQFLDTSKKMGGRKEALIINGSTACSITKMFPAENNTTGWEEYPLGIAICHISDNFSYETGRKISLKRAIQTASLPKQERKVIWEAYRTMTKINRW